MGGYNLNFTHNSFLLHLLFFFLIHVPIHALGDVCANVDCVRGTCVPNDTSILGYDCVCNSGWKKVQIGFFTFPSCVLPNCTLNLQCGSGAPPAPAPPAPPFNLSSPCNLVWCGEGTCIANGTGHYCQCNEGSANLFNFTGLPCFKQCSFGVDCNGVSLGPIATTPPPPPSPNGSSKISKSWMSLNSFYMISLSAIILASIM